MHHILQGFYQFPPAAKLASSIKSSIGRFFRALVQPRRSRQRRSNDSEIPSNNCLPDVRRWLGAGGCNNTLNGISVGASQLSEKLETAIKSIGCERPVTLCGILYHAALHNLAQFPIGVGHDS
jgi:hypothetical protein